MKRPDRFENLSGFFILYIFIIFVFMNNIQTLYPGEYYHVFNKAVDKNLLFRSHLDYIIFYQKIRKYLKDVVGIYAYSLMPNHFHFLIKVLEFEHVQRLKPEIQDAHQAHLFVSKQFSNLFNSYSKNYNKRYERKGSLFLRPFKRIRLESELDFTRVVLYIHRNPIHHKYVKELKHWIYSSYTDVLLNKPSIFRKEELINWFSSKETFIKMHEEASGSWLKDFGEA